MKKFIIAIFLFLLCSTFFVAPFSSMSVEAAETGSIMGSVDDSTVYYQALVSDGSSFYAFNGVSQKYYKDTRNLSNDNDGSTVRYNKGDTAYTGLGSDDICNNEKFSSTSSICSKGEMKSNLAKLRITYSGNVYIDLQKDVAVTNLRFYYIIANKSNQAQLFCEENEICDNAKRVIGSNSNWKNLAKSGYFVYNETTIKEAFTKEINNSTDAVQYKNFNIFEKMDFTYASLAQKAGIYVIASMTIRYKDVTYYLNDYPLSGSQDNPFQFTGIGNTDTNEQSYATVISNPISPNLGINATTHLVSNYAALVVPDTNLGVEGNKGFKTANDLFIEYIPLIMIVIGIMFFVTGISTGITIVKSSDEPEVRSSAIKKLIGLFTGALVIELILLFYEDIINAFSAFL